jgi:hypothetical protein
MELVKCLSVFDENGRYAPVYDESDKMEIEVMQYSGGWSKS